MKFNHLNVDRHYYQMEILYYCYYFLNYYIMAFNYHLKLVIAAAITNAILSFVAGVLPRTGLGIVDNILSNMEGNSFDLISSSVTLAISIIVACTVMKKLKL